MKKKLCRVLAIAMIAFLVVIAYPIVLIGLIISLIVAISFGIIWVFQQAFGDEQD